MAMRVRWHDEVSLQERTVFAMQAVGGAHKRVEQIKGETSWYLHVINDVYMN